MHTLVKSIFAAAVAAVSIAATAQPFAPIDTRDIDARQARQEQRIQQGIRRGELTRREATELRRGQHEIARAEARAKSDGRVTVAEHRRLVAMLDQADARIRQLRHDRDGRRSS